MNKKKQKSEDLFDIEELCLRGYEEESIRFMFMMRCSQLFNESPDYESDPQGWLDYNV